MRRSRSVGTGPGRQHHGSPVVFTTGSGEGRTAMRPRAHGHASPAAFFLRLLRACSISCTFMCFQMLFCA